MFPPEYRQFLLNGLPSRTWQVDSASEVDKRNILRGAVQQWGGNLGSTRTASQIDLQLHSWGWLVLATGPGNPPAVQVWTRKTVWFGSRTVKKPTLCIVAVQTRPCTCQPAGFAGFGKTCRVQSLVLHFGLFYLWWCSDIVLLLVKYQRCYIDVIFGWTCHLCDQNM